MKELFIFFYVLCFGFSASVCAIDASAEGVDSESQRIAIDIAGRLRLEDETRWPDFSEDDLHRIEHRAMSESEAQLRQTLYRATRFGITTEQFDSVNLSDLSGDSEAHTIVREIVSNPDPATYTIVRAAISEVEAQRERVSKLGWSNHTRALLYGRERQGGNLLHFIARHKGIKPETARTAILTWWAEHISVRALSKVLKHRDNDGYTPKELAKSLQNEVAFEALSQAEDILNKRNEKNLVKSAVVTVGTVGAGIAGNLIEVLSAGETAVAVGAGGLATIWCLNHFKKQQIHKTSSQF